MSFQIIGQEMCELNFELFDRMLIKEVQKNTSTHEKIHVEMTN